MWLFLDIIVDIFLSIITIGSLTYLNPSFPIGSRQNEVNLLYSVKK